MAKRQCQATTVKSGVRCRAAALTDSDFCIAHSDEETRQSAGFGGSQDGAGRPKQPRVVDVMRERVEGHVEEILAPYFDAIENAVLTATHEGEVIASEVPDLGGRIAAAEKLLDRVYGRPKQAVEHSGTVDPVNVEVSLDASTREAIASALRRRPAAR